MKKLMIISAIAASGFIYNSANAQIRARFGFRPQIVVYNAAPVAVEQAPVYEQTTPADDPNDLAYADTTDDYYYLPDVDAYYDVTDQCYFYFDGGSWISAAYLPGEYRNYDWRNAPRFEVRAPRPYMHDDFYRSKYNGRQVAAWSRPNDNNKFDRGYAKQGVQQTKVYNQPAQQNRQNVQQFNNRGNQPAYQNNNRFSDNRGGGTEHFVQNHAQNNLPGRRMSRS